jgi:hypothetical protein
MEDAIALAREMQNHTRVADALESYELVRRPGVESVQRAAQVSLQWFEETERYFGRLEPMQFAFSMLTRSLRITHTNLKLRDPGFVRSVDAGSQARPRTSPASTCRSIRRRRRCSRRCACASWCSPTASWCRRCANTRPRTARRPTGISCISAAAPSAAPA